MKPVVDRMLSVNAGIQQDEESAVNTAVQSGRYQGELAKLVQNSSSLIESAAEELTFGLANKKGDSRTRKSSKKELKDSLGIKSQLIREVERKQHLEDSTDKMKKRNMHQVRQLRAFLESYDSDRYEQYRLLQYASASFGESPKDSALMALIDEAKQELESSDGEIIRAGINIQGVADQFVNENSGLENKDLQGLYRGAVLDYGGLTETCQKIMEQHSAVGTEKSINFLLKALAADYRTHGSSIDKNHLSVIMRDMQQLRLLNTLHEHCCDVLARRDLPGYTSEQFMQDVLAMQDSKWLEDAVIPAFALRAGSEGSEQTIGFLRDLKGVFNLLPAEKFDGGYDQRDQILDAIQSCQDHHTKVEEVRV